MTHNIFHPQHLPTLYISRYNEGVLFPPSHPRPAYSAQLWSASFTNFNQWHLGQTKTASPFSAVTPGLIKRHSLQDFLVEGDVSRPILSSTFWDGCSFWWLKFRLLILRLSDQRLKQSQSEDLISLQNNSTSRVWITKYEEEKGFFARF